MLIDYGLVQAVSDANEAGSTLFAGQCDYRAPESIQGQSSPASDLFSVGVLAEWLSGKPAASLRTVPMDPVPVARILGFGVSRALVQWIGHL